MLEFAKKNNIYSVLLFGETDLKTPLSAINGEIDLKNANQDYFYKAHPESYYVGSDMVDFSMYSQGGAHLLQLPNLKKVIFAGGHLFQCLCESIRDVIRSVSELEHKKIEIILLSDAIYDGNLSLGDSIVYSKSVVDYLHFEIFGRHSEEFCPEQNTSPLRPIERSQFRFFLDDGKQLVEFGEAEGLSQSKGSNHVVFKIMSIKQLKEHLLQ